LLPGEKQALTEQEARGALKEVLEILRDAALVEHQAM
jgi:hypothetical protein